MPLPVSSSSTPPSPAGSRLPSHPRPARFTQRRVRIGACVLVLLGVWALWYNEHRTIGWGQTFNPIYWWHRWHGDDLYDIENAVLMHGNRDLPEVALTFDDGPHPESRGRILDTLRQYGAHATFFDVGRRMDESPDLVRRTLAEGHEIGNHSYNHNRLPPLSPLQRHREINDVDITFYRITGQHLTLLRPPGMNYDQTVLDDTKRLGYVLVGNTTESRDYDLNESPDFIADRTLHRTENGSIILLHDYSPTALALPRILAALRADGYRCVTVSEMLAHLPDRQRLAAERFLRQQEEPAPVTAATSSTGSVDKDTRVPH